jgi:tRNA(Ile)-lysidine synthase
MSESLKRRVLRAIRRHGLAAPADRVLVALSGGSDSVALTWLLRDLASDAGFEIAGLVHVNHGLRGDASDADEAFCRALAARMGLPIDVARVDVAALARARKRSTEATARDARYACFAAAAARLGATRIATGHTLDDQAETVLLRLLRGAGSRGLTGIRVQRSAVVRPLLDCRRADLVAYLSGRHEPFREDASNDDRTIPRNRVRHELLPVIDRIAPGARRALARVAALSADDEEYFRHAVIDSTSAVVLSEGGLRLDGIGARPPALARRIARWAIEAVVPGVGLTARHLDAVLALATSPAASGHLDLPGVVVERRGEALSIHAAPPAGVARNGRVQFEYPLPCPGEVAVPEAGVTVLASLAPSDARGLAAGADVATVRQGAFAPPFSVRNRRGGDRFRPLGAPGRRKLQDVFVDKKVPREDRDRVPIVTDSTGRIVWVVGIAIADEGRVTAASEGVVILIVKKGPQ